MIYLDIATCGPAQDVHRAVELDSLRFAFDSNQCCFHDLDLAFENVFTCPCFRIMTFVSQDIFESRLASGLFPV